VPSAAATVTGKAAAAAEAVALPAAALAPAADVVLEDEEQLASTAVQATVPSTAANRRGILIAGYFLPMRREGRRDRWGATRSMPRRPGRITLPTRADIVWRAVGDLA